MTLTSDLVEQDGDAAEEMRMVWARVRRVRMWLFIVNQRDV